MAYNQDTLQPDSNIDPNEFRRYLEQTLLGRTVLESIAVGQLDLPVHIGGSDASVQAISLASVLPWQVESGDLNIVTAIGVRYDIFKGVRDLDRYPEPKVLAQYERKQAIQEGLLIPPTGTIGYDEDFEARVKEAAMNLRQYVKDHDLMFVNEPAVKIHFRDGRIFPYEHRMYDAIQPGLHGEIVRSALKIFRNITNAIGAERGKVLYCGFVKRTGVAIMAPLFFWYVGFGSGENGGKLIDNGMTLEEFLKSPASDNVVVNRLFAALGSMNGSESVYVTFRILRRFQAMEEPILQGFAPSTDVDLWIRRLEEVAKNILATDPRHTGVELIATLCARASVLEFYSSLPGQLDPKFEQSVFIPRIECLVPYSDLDGAQDSRPIGLSEINYVQRILSVMFHPGVLENYPDELVPFGRGSPKIFLIPKPVVESHLSAKLIAQVYRDDFLELLVREARIYWLSVRGIGRGGASLT